MSERTETEIKSMTKEQNYMCGYRDGKSDVLDKIRAEIEQEYTKFRNKTDMWNERACGLGTALEIIDKYKSESGG